MSDEVIELKTYDNEIDALMVQQMLQQTGVQASISKDDGGGMEPQLQRTMGVRLLVNRSELERAQKALLKLA